MTLFLSVGDWSTTNVGSEWLAGVCLEPSMVWTFIGQHTTNTATIIFALNTPTTLSASRRPFCSSNPASSTAKDTKTPVTEYPTSELYSDEIDRQLVSAVTRSPTQRTFCCRENGRIWWLYLGYIWCSFECLTTIKLHYILLGCAWQQGEWRKCKFRTDFLFSIL